MHNEKLKDFRILIVEDQESNIRFLEKLLARDGYRHVRSTSDSRKAKATFQEYQPDLVLLDLHMPHMDGFEVMEAIKPDIPEGAFVPILVLTADREPEVKIRCLSVGAKDFVAKPFRADEVLLRIRNLLETRNLNQSLEDRNVSLELEVQARSFQVQAAQMEVLHRLAVAAEYRDDITGRHAGRVGMMAGRLAEEYGVGAEDVSLLREAAPLHDVGKIGIPDAILLKPGRLSEEEFEVMKGHTTIGGMILSKGSFRLLDFAKEIALSHHEWWDGSGYPNGLKGEDIPVAGRIVAIADVFDSVSHERPYKKAFSVEQTLEIMHQEGANHFDPHLLGLFTELVEAGEMDGFRNAPSKTNGRFEHPVEALRTDLFQGGDRASVEDPYSLSPSIKRLLWKTAGEA
jgi:putative two-component system response regulator